MSGGQHLSVELILVFCATLTIKRILRLHMS